MKETAYKTMVRPILEYRSSVWDPYTQGLIDNRLTFENHINEKVNKANSIMGVIRRTFEFLDIKTFRLLFTPLVRPHIEYANQVWNPYLKKHIDMLENVQRRATKSIPGLW